LKFATFAPEQKGVIKAAKRIFNSDKICCSYCDFYFVVTFLEHSVEQFITMSSIILDQK